MKTLEHSPAYVLQIRRHWRIVVPVRGKLTPAILPEEFPCEASARAWLASSEGADEVQARRRVRTQARASSGMSQASAAV